MYIRMYVSTVHIRHIRMYVRTYVHTIDIGHRLYVRGSGSHFTILWQCSWKVAQISEVC